MKTVQFTDQELESMINMYFAELEEAHAYIAQIEEILTKLGAKPSKTEVVEKEPKVGKKRGRKVSVNVVEKAEPKKRGRKKSLPTQPEVSVVAEPLKKVEKVAKVKRAYKKKAAITPTSVPTATAKSVPVAATKANTKKKAEPKPVPTKAATVAAKVKKEVVKPEPKPKKIAASKAKAEKEPVVKPAPKKSLNSKFIERIRDIFEPELTDPKKEEVKKVAKKKAVRKSKPKGVTLVKLSKPLPKKEATVEPVVETPPVAPIAPIEPTEQS